MAWLGHNSQRPVAHCRFHRRDELDPTEKWRLKDTRLTLLLSLARSQSHLPFSSIVAMQTSNSQTSPFPRTVPLRGWQRSSLIPAECCKNQTLLYRIQWKCKKNYILWHCNSSFYPLLFLIISPLSAICQAFPSAIFLPFFWTLWH